MNHTNKKLLGKGLRFLAAALPLLALGPIILTSAFKNQDKPLYIPVLILAIIVMATAIFLIFKGVMTVMKALFD